MSGRYQSEQEPPTDKLKVVGTVPLFSALPQSDWEKVADLLGERTYEKDEYILFEGDPPEALYVVWTGRVKLVRHSREGRDVVLDVIGPNRLLGEMAVFEKEARSASVKAVGKSRGLKVDKTTLLRRITEDPLLAINLLKHMSHRIRALDELMSHNQSAPE